MAVTTADIPFTKEVKDYSLDPKINASGSNTNVLRITGWTELQVESGVLYYCSGSGQVRLEERCNLLGCSDEGTGKDDMCQSEKL